MPYIETPDQIPIYYRDEGPRTSSGIFLIHAAPFNSKFWYRNIPTLSQEFRTVAIDVRGFGESGKTDEGHSLAQYAHDVRHLLTILQLDRVVAVGWSVGSAILWNYIEQFGEDRLAGYVNVDQQPYNFVSEDHFQKEIAAVRTRRLSYYKETMEKYLGPEVSHDQATIDWMAYESLKLPTSAYCTAATESYHADYRSTLSKVLLPTRIFWAKYGVIQPEMAQFMHAAMPNSKLVFFEHSGHLFPWVESDKFNTELARFAREVLSA